MSNTSDEIKYTICDICGHEKKCFVAHQFGTEQSICPDCFRNCPDHLRVINRE